MYTNHSVYTFIIIDPFELRMLVSEHVHGDCVNNRISVLPSFVDCVNHRISVLLSSVDCQPQN